MFPLSKGRLSGKCLPMKLKGGKRVPPDQAWSIDSKPQGRGATGSNHVAHREAPVNQLTGTPAVSVCEDWYTNSPEILSCIYAFISSVKLEFISMFCSRTQSLIMFCFRLMLCHMFAMYIFA